MTKTKALQFTKKSHTTARGVSLDGKRDKQSLSVRGWQRAGALACLFSGKDHLGKGDEDDSPIAVPDLIYASQPIKRFGSRRSVETVKPLADKLGIEINTDFLKFEFKIMIEHALARQGAVLICWQYEYIPRIARCIPGSLNSTAAANHCFKKIASLSQKTQAQELRNVMIIRCAKRFTCCTSSHNTNKRIRFLPPDETYFVSTRSQKVKITVFSAFSVKLYLLCKQEK